MSTKAWNISHFYGPGYGPVQLVKRSVGKFAWHGQIRDQYGIWCLRVIVYWRGQLVNDFIGERPETNEKWCLYKGKVIWLDANIFYKMPGTDYLDYTNT